MKPDAWNPYLYQDSHAFVWEFGRGLIDSLAPRPGERILDLGCGTGQLTAEIAARGAIVTGLDLSADMIAEAACNFPALHFVTGSATSLPFHSEFDAVFSNAVLHWVRDAGAAASGMARALKTGGRLAVEFGGYANIRALLDCVCEALRSAGVPDPEALNPWYFPKLGEYCSLLESQGLLVTQAAWFERPTALEDGAGALQKWIEMFGGAFLRAIAPDVRAGFFRDVERRAACSLLANGVWTVDYRRLRVLARKA